MARDGVTAAAADAITIRELSKSYRTRDGLVVALESITTSVGEGEFVAVVGPSGCGKSTLLEILAGILAPTSGRALLRGTAIAGPRRDIGVVFQSPVLFPWRTVLDNVLLRSTCRAWAARGTPRPPWSSCPWSAWAASSNATCGSCPAGCSSAWPSPAR